jgi:hypothetical protein
MEEGHLADWTDYSYLEKVDIFDIEEDIAEPLYSWLPSRQHPYKFAILKNSPKTKECMW